MSCTSSCSAEMPCDEACVCWLIKIGEVDEDDEEDGRYGGDWRDDEAGESSGDDDGME